MKRKQKVAKRKQKVTKWNKKQRNGSRDMPFLKNSNGTETKSNETEKKVAKRTKSDKTEQKVTKRNEK